MSDLLNFYIDDDSVIKESIIDPKRNIGQEEIVMDKKTFKECYKKWILEDAEKTDKPSECPLKEVEESDDCVNRQAADSSEEVRMTLDEAIKNEEENAIQQIEKANALDNIPLFGMSKDDIEEIKECYKCSKEYEQLAEWLKELKLLMKDRKTGEWQRMSDLPEDEDDRYRCSCCGNVVHSSNKVNLYTFNRWCGKCGSNNGRR